MKIKLTTGFEFPQDADEVIEADDHYDICSGGQIVATVMKHSLALMYEMPQKKGSKKVK